MIHLTLEDLEALVKARIAEASAEKSLATAKIQPPLEPSPPSLSAQTYSHVKHPHYTPTAFTNKPFSNLQPVPPSRAPIDHVSPPSTPVMTYSPPKTATSLPTTTTPPVPFTRYIFSALPANKLTTFFRADPAPTPISNIKHLVTAPRTARAPAQHPVFPKDPVHNNSVPNAPPTAESPSPRHNDPRLKERPNA
jgi:hypothetical protein